MSDGLWRKDGPKEETKKKVQFRHEPAPKPVTPYVGPDGKQYENPTAYYRSLTK